VLQLDDQSGNRSIGMPSFPGRVEVFVYSLAGGSSDRGAVDTIDATSVVVVVNGSRMLLVSPRGIRWGSVAV
jgi:hypothetical protein